MKKFALTLISSFFLFGCSTSNNDKKEEQLIANKKPCPLSISTTDGSSLFVVTGKENECLRLSYGSIGFDWPVMTNISYHLKNGSITNGVSTKPTLEKIDETDLRFYQSEISIETILDDAEKSGISPEDVEYFHIFSVKDERVISNNCFFSNDGGKDNYKISCEPHT